MLHTGEKPTRFFYPPDGKVYFVVSFDTDKRQMVLERIDRPQEDSGQLPRLEEAQQVLVTVLGADGGKESSLLYRGRLTEEIDQNGRFLTAKWYCESWVPPGPGGVNFG
jgi:hypothetical protein